MFKNRLFALTALCTALMSAPSWAQTKWDFPTAYPAANFHTENIQQFASDVEKATGGKLKMTVHANASLFKAPEIKRAVQGGQAQIGEILLTNFANENPLFEVDSVPFLATSYADSMKLYRSSGTRSASSAASTLAAPDTSSAGRRAYQRYQSRM